MGASSSGNFRLAIYDGTGSAGGPGHLLTQSAYTAAPASAGPVTVGVIPVFLNPGDYYLVVQMDSTNVVGSLTGSETNGSYWSSVSLADNPVVTSTGVNPAHVEALGCAPDQFGSTDTSAGFNMVVSNNDPATVFVGGSVFAMPNNATVHNLQLYVVSAPPSGGQLRTALYDNTGTSGTPGTILAQSGWQTVNSGYGPGWLTFVVPDTALTVNSYWLVFEAQATVPSESWTFYYESNAALGYQIIDPLQVPFPNLSGRFRNILATYTMTAVYN